MYIYVSIFMYVFTGFVMFGQPMHSMRAGLIKQGTRKILHRLPFAGIPFGLNCRWLS